MGHNSDLILLCVYYLIITVLYYVHICHVIINVLYYVYVNDLFDIYNMYIQVVRRWQYSGQVAASSGQGEQGEGDSVVDRWLPQVAKESRARVTV